MGSVDGDAKIISARQEFFPAPLASLAHDTLGIDLYLLHNPEGEPALYRSAGLPFSPPDAARLASSGVKFVYIPLQQHGAYREMMLNATERAFKDPAIALAERGKMVRSTCSKIIEDVLLFPGWSGALDAVSDIAGHFAEWSEQFPREFSYVLDMTAHDFYTTTHMINVGVACGMLVREIRPGDTELMHQVMQGGLLHDIGKRSVPEYILNKGGKLTAEEWELLRLHPVKGYDELKEREGVSQIMLEMTRDHHEKLDGSGYPHALRGSQISFHARLCAVVDIYDALTTSRPYRGPIAPIKTLQIMREEVGTKLDSDIFAAWEAIVHRLLREDPARSFGSRIGSAASVTAAPRDRKPSGPLFADEQRRYPRHTCRMLGQAVFEYKGKAVGPDVGVWFPVGISDIGQGGLGLRFEFAPSKGDVLRVRVPGGTDGPLERPCEIVRIRQMSDGAWGIGVRFTGLISAAA